MQRVEVFMFDTFREKIRLTKELASKGMLYVGEGFVIVDYWEDIRSGQGFKKKDTK